MSSFRAAQRSQTQGSHCCGHVKDRSSHPTPIAVAMASGDRTPPSARPCWHAVSCVPAPAAVRPRTMPKLTCISLRHPQGRRQRTLDGNLKSPLCSSAFRACMAAATNSCPWIRKTGGIAGHTSPRVIPPAPLCLHEFHLEACLPRHQSLDVTPSASSDGTPDDPTISHHVYACIMPRTSDRASVDLDRSAYIQSDVAHGVTECNNMPQNDRQGLWLRGDE